MIEISVNEVNQMISIIGRYSLNEVYPLVVDIKESYDVETGMLNLDNPNQIVKYLESQPYNEVAILINKLSTEVD